MRCDAEKLLNALKLPTFAREYEKTARQCAEGDKHYEEFLLSLAEMEVAERQRKSTARRMRQAKFPAEKDLADFDFGAVPTLNRRRVQELSRGEYMERHENIVLVGPAGVGKTHLALRREACRRGRKVRFFTASGLATAYAEAREERQVQRLERHTQKGDLVIVDELAYVPPGHGAAENLYGFFSLCYERVSVIVTTNLPFSEWPEIFCDERLGGALIDRLTHHVHVVEIQGESYRLKASLAARPEDGGQSPSSGKEGGAETTETHRPHQWPEAAIDRARGGR